MRKLYWLIGVGVVVCGVTVFLTGGGCGDNEVITGGTAPAPFDPPSSVTIAMDFGNFVDTVGTFKGEAASPATQDAWQRAADAVAYWNGNICLQLIVPLTAMLHPNKGTAVRQSSGWWQWSYNFIVGDAGYSAKLRGIAEEDDICWELLISKHEDYSDFKWLTGSHDANQTFGTWIVLKNPNDETPLLQVDWDQGTGSGRSDLEYMNIMPGADSGSYIQYVDSGDTPYDCSFDILRVGLADTTEVEWTSSTGAGRVSYDDGLGGTDWSCWDEDHNDIDCP